MALIRSQIGYSIVMLRLLPKAGELGEMTPILQSLIRSEMMSLAESAPMSCFDR
jgi:hypothetical protein